MRARVIAVIVAAVLAVVGVVALISYAGNAQERAYKNAKLVEVYQVKTLIEANSGSDAVAKAVKKVKLPQSAVASGAVTSLATIKGLKATVDLQPGEQLLAARFSKTGAKAPDQVDVPKGLQQISVQLTQDASGQLKAGDTVGVIVSSEVPTTDGKTVDASRMIADQVLVVTYDEASGNSQSGGIVTLAVTEKQAAQIATGSNYGKIRLTLQNDQTDPMKGTVVSLPQLFN